MASEARFGYHFVFVRDLQNVGSERRGGLTRQIALNAARGHTQSHRQYHRSPSSLFSTKRNGTMVKHMLRIREVSGSNIHLDTRKS
jgi:hypothetical protein